MTASIESVAYELGGVLGVTILGSILSFTYAKALVLPQGIPAPALAMDSVDQALLLAEHLSGDATVKLITQAKTAFDIAFVTVLVAGTAITLLCTTHRSARREDSASVCWFAQKERSFR
jgi:DHA2 family multidrug resistance protein-like MFS transporter